MSEKKINPLFTMKKQGPRKPNNATNTTPTPATSAPKNVDTTQQNITSTVPNPQTEQTPNNTTTIRSNTVANPTAKRPPLNLPNKSSIKTTTTPNEEQNNTQQENNTTEPTKQPANDSSTPTTTSRKVSPQFGLPEIEDNHGEQVEPLILDDNNFGQIKNITSAVPARKKTEKPSLAVTPNRTAKKNTIFLGHTPPNKPTQKPTENEGLTQEEQQTLVGSRQNITKPNLQPTHNPFTPKPATEHKDQRPSVLPATTGATAADWDDTTTPDWEKLNTPEEITPQLGQGFHLTDRDITIIRFLAKYRYAYNFQIARRVQTSAKAIRPRLKMLEKKGFLRKQPVSGALVLWMTTKAGNLVADIDAAVPKKTEWSWTQVGHTAGLTNIGIELEIGGENLLKEQVWPQMNAVDLRGNPIMGEKIISEKEIRSAQLKWRNNRRTEEMNELVQQAVRDPGEPETDTGGLIRFPLPPESVEGNEGLFVIYSNTGEHVPDMVVNRGRDEDGNPINIAIELELNEKPHKEWIRILRAFRDYGTMYSKIVYFTNKTNIANQLMQINDNSIGMPRDKFIVRKYIPTQGREAFWG